MPRIELIDPVLYGPSDPYQWEIDNLPLKNILDRQNLINLAVDDLVAQMRDAIGTQGSVANRLNQSINPDGSLKATAIDAAGHSIEAHADGDTYVRMTKAQSAKLDLVADEATKFSVEVYAGDGTFVDFGGGLLKVKPSDTVTPRFEAPDNLLFDMAFPPEAAHRHYYSLTPVPQNLVSPDLINYKVDSAATPYVPGSLRVYVNGMRIFEGHTVYVPGFLVDDPWTLLSFTSSAATGTFSVSAALAEEDVVFIDFDQLLS